MLFTVYQASLCRSCVAVMAFTASPAIMGYTNGIIKSPGSAARPALWFITAVRSHCYISLDTARDFTGKKKQQKTAVLPIKTTPTAVCDIIVG